MKGELLLLPNLLNKDLHHSTFLPSSVDRAVSTLDGIIAESEKEARAYLKRFTFSEERTFRDIPIRVFNEHSQEVDSLLEPLRKGEKWGLISDAGLPVIADPGYQLVRRAADFGIQVKSFVGPNSMIQALMLSGLPAQSFAFHGYLPRNDAEKVIKTLEMRSEMEHATQLFMETPYRNMVVFKMLMDTLSDGTLLSVAWNLTLPTQGVETHPIKVWKKRALPALDKSPAIFLFFRPAELSQ